MANLIVALLSGHLCLLGCLGNEVVSLGREVSALSAKVETNGEQIEAKGERVEDLRNDMNRGFERIENFLVHAAQ